MVVPFKRCKLGSRPVEIFFRFLLFLRFCAGFSGAFLLFSIICTIHANLGLGLNSNKYGSHCIIASVQM